MSARTMFASATLALALGLGSLSAASALPLAPAATLAAGPDATVQTVQYYGGYRHRYYRGSGLRREGWYPGQGLRRAEAYRARHRFYRGY